MSGFHKTGLVLPERVTLHRLVLQPDLILVKLPWRDENALIRCIHICAVLNREVD